MTELVGAKSLFFLSLDGTYKAMGYNERNKELPQFTDHCFTGDYPITITDQLTQPILSLSKKDTL